MERPSVAGSVSRKGEKWLAQLPPSLGRGGKVHATEEGAWEWLRVENAKATLGMVDAAKIKHATVSELIDVWLASAVLAKSTHTDYKIRINKHIKAHPIGAYPIDTVRGMHVDKCLLDTPPNWTRIHVGKILSKFFGWAESNQFTVGNPYRQSEHERIMQLAYRTVERRESTDNVWEPEQLITFIEHEPCPVFRDYWIFTAATGARRGEAIGARWVNMKIDDGWGWLADNITAAGNEIFHNDLPKNYKRRKAYFGPMISAMLNARREDQKEYRAGCPSWAGDFVFDRRRGKGPRFYHGVHLAPATVTQRFNRHATELRLPSLAGPHGMRRTFATFLENDGLKPSVLTAAMGHAPDITGRYTKPSDADMRELATRIERLVTRG